MSENDYREITEEGKEKPAVVEGQEQETENEYEDFCYRSEERRVGKECRL